MTSILTWMTVHNDWTEIGLKIQWLLSCLILNPPSPSRWIWTSHRRSANNPKVMIMGGQGSSGSPEWFFYLNLAVLFYNLMLIFYLLDICQCPKCSNEFPTASPALDLWPRWWWGTCVCADRFPPTGPIAPLGLLSATDFSSAIPRAIPRQLPLKAPSS